MSSKPRILILSAYYHPFIGGVETHARAIAKYLHEQGFDVSVLTKHAETAADSYTAVDGISILRVPPIGPRSMTSKWRMIPFAIARLFALRRHFDMIYCPGYQGIGIAALVAGHLLRKPVILQAGNLGVLSCSNWDSHLRALHLPPQGWLARLLKWPMQRLYASAAAFACIAREIETEARQYGVAPERIHYLPNTVDVRRFRPPKGAESEAIRAEEGWPAAAILCAFAGRLSLEKGVLELVSAWKTIAGDRTKLIVIGPDMSGHPMDGGPRMREMVHATGLDPHVIFCGARQDVDRLLRAIDIFVQPSHFEAFGISVIEAMAVGLPVVATATGGMLDYLRDGDNALLCKPKSARALAEPIDRLVNDAELRGRLGRMARRDVEKQFSENAVFSRYAAMFQAVAAATTK